MLPRLVLGLAASASPGNLGPVPLKHTNTHAHTHPKKKKSQVKKPLCGFVETKVWRWKEHEFESPSRLSPASDCSGSLWVSKDRARFAEINSIQRGISLAGLLGSSKQLWD